MAAKRGASGKFVKGNKSGTPKKAARTGKKMPTFLKKKLGKKGGGY